MGQLADWKLKLYPCKLDEVWWLVERTFTIIAYLAAWIKTDETWKSELDDFTWQFKSKLGP